MKCFLFLSQIIPHLYDNRVKWLCNIVSLIIHAFQLKHKQLNVLSENKFQHWHATFKILLVPLLGPIIYASFRPLLNRLTFDETRSESNAMIIWCWYFRTCGNGIYVSVRTNGDPHGTNIKISGFDGEAWCSLPSPPLIFLPDIGGLLATAAVKPVVPDKSLSGHFELYKRNFRTESWADDKARGRWLG